MGGEIANDTAYIANRLSWKGATLFGLVLFAIFYWLLPFWITHQLFTTEPSNVLRPMLEALLGRRVHWFQWLGIALALICGFFAVRSYLQAARLDGKSERQAGFLGRLIARWLD